MSRRGAPTGTAAASMIALLQAKAAGLWTRSHIRNNVVAGVVVGVVALPLAMAFAIASGARPEQGLYTSIVAAALTSLFGGTRVQISGPTGAFVAVLAIITAQHGIAGLQIATLMAGVILMAFGFARLGRSSSTSRSLSSPASPRASPSSFSSGSGKTSSG